MYSTQTTLTRSSGQTILTVKSNGGYVQVEKAVGSDWIVSDTFTVDGAFPLNVGTTQTRFTPFNGATFEVQ